MKQGSIFIFLFVLSIFGVQAKDSHSLELPRIQVVPIEDTASGRQYELYIKLPEGYLKDKQKKHPVIYTTDAMWHIEILSGSAEFIVDDAILVGISWQKDTGEQRAHVSRFRDYTIMKSENPSRPRGEASNHLNFIRNDVINYVEKHYQADPTNRTYFGYSLGGMFGAYALLTKPDTFKNYIIGSPTTLADDSNIYEFEAIKKLKNKTLNANVFVSVGSLEREDMVRHAVGLDAALKSKKYENTSSKLVVIEDEDHGSAFPMTAVRSMYWLAKQNNK